MSEHTTVFTPVSVGLHKYQTVIFLVFFFFKKKVVGFQESEKFKYYAFV